MEQRIGKYRVIKLLGAGAFAEVFLAEDPVTGRKVAIKRCAAEGARRDSLLAECRLLVQLEHPHIVTVFDADVVPPYFVIVMEYMAGGSLAASLGGEIKAADWAVAVTLQILSALAYAHGRRVIHRDVKPANILFTAEHKAKLGDFGVARVLAATQRAAHTKVGTVPYMAPEQLEGRATFQSDLYAAGTVLYEMATGAQAFDGETDYVIMKKIERAEFAPPREVNAGVPLWLEAVILKAMAQDPRARYGTAAEMARALREGDKGAVAPEAKARALEETKTAAAAGGPPVEKGREETAAEIRSGEIKLQKFKAAAKKTVLVWVFLGGFLGYFLSLLYAVGNGESPGTVMGFCFFWAVVGAIFGFGIAVFLINRRER